MKNFGKKFSLLIFILCFVLTVKFDGMVSNVKGQGFKLQTSVLINQNNNFEYRAETFAMKKGYLALDPSEVTYIDSNGIPQWKKTLASQNVDGAISKNWMVLCEKKSGDLFVLDIEGVVTAEKFALGPVESVDILNDTYIAVLKQNRELVLLDRTLKIASTTILPKGKIVDFGLNPQNTEIVIGLMDLSRSDFNTKVLFTDLQGRIKSGSHVYEAIPYDLFLEDDRIIMVVDSGFLLYNYRGEQISKIETTGTIQRFYYDAKNQEVYVHLLSDGSDLKNSSPESQIVVYDNMGAELRQFKPPFKDIKGIKRFGNDLFIYNETSLFVVNNEGRVLKKFDFKEEIKTVHSVDSGSFAVTFVGKMDVYVKK